jgi:predicted nucleic acid-binding protein
MPVVVDASVALAWCFEDEHSLLADSVLESLGDIEAVAPSIWPLEIANGLRSAERRGRLDERELPSVTRLLAALPIRVEVLGLERTLTDVLPLARALELSAYDAAYIDLALRSGWPLATADDVLARAAVAAGAELVVPPQA